MSQRRKTAVALGKPLDTPDADLDMLALVTIEDIEAAYRLAGFTEEEAMMAMRGDEVTGIEQ